jgi:hypothetical protein
MRPLPNLCGCPKRTSRKKCARSTAAGYLVRDVGAQDAADGGARRHNGYSTFWPTRTISQSSTHMPPGCANDAAVAPLCRLTSRGALPSSGHARMNTPSPANMIGPDCWGGESLRSFVMPNKGRMTTSRTDNTSLFLKLAMSTSVGGVIG